MAKLLIAGLGALALSACGGNGDDKLGQDAQDAAEARADNLDAEADNSSGSREDMLEAQADTEREIGEEREEAIDDSDVNAEAMTAQERERVVNGN